MTWVLAVVALAAFSGGAVVGYGLRSPGEHAAVVEADRIGQRPAIRQQRLVLPLALVQERLVRRSPRHPSRSPGALTMPGDG